MRKLRFPALQMVSLTKALLEGDMEGTLGPTPAQNASSEQQLTMVRSAEAVWTREGHF